MSCFRGNVRGMRQDDMIRFPVGQGQRLMQAGKQDGAAGDGIAAHGGPYMASADARVAAVSGVMAILKFSASAMGNTTKTSAVTGRRVSICSATTCRSASCGMPFGYVSSIMKRTVTVPGPIS